MRSRIVVLGALAAALACASAKAEVRITDDMGGLMTEYASRFASLRETGEKVVVDGPCYSACTMLLGLLPRSQVCVTPRAVFGFHAAWNFDDGGRRVTSPTATHALLDLYPSHVRGWIAKHGGLSPQLKYMRGREIYPACGGSPTVRTEATRHRGRPVRNVAISASARSAAGH